VSLTANTLAPDALQTASAAALAREGYGALVTEIRAEYGALVRSGRGGGGTRLRRFTP
jgi:hypothetical protein